MGLRYDANGNVTAITPPGKPAHGFSYTPVDLESAYLPPSPLRKRKGVGSLFLTSDDPGRPDESGGAGCERPGGARAGDGPGAGELYL